MTFEVRPAVLSDAETIAELHVSTWQETYSDLLPAGFFDDEHRRGRQAMWHHILSNPRSDWRTFVAEGPNGPVGFAMSGPSFGDEGEDPPRDRQLFNLYATRVVHGTGVGQRLLEAVLGADPAMLWVAQQNPRAIAFYRRNGFEFDGIEKDDPRAPLITDARMVR